MSARGLIDAATTITAKVHFGDLATKMTIFSPHWGYSMMLITNLVSKILKEVTKSVYKNEKKITI